MKKNKFESRLKLNKQTIVNLGFQNLNNIKGGTVIVSAATGRELQCHNVTELCNSDNCNQAPVATHNCNHNPDKNTTHNQKHVM